jgi:hypothetical protein
MTLKTVISSANREVECDGSTLTWRKADCEGREEMSERL